MRPTLNIVGAAVAIGAVIVIALTLSMTSSAVSQSPTEDLRLAKVVEAKFSGRGLSPVFDLNDAGSDAALSEVMNSFRLSQPTYLPSGTSQPQVKISNDGSYSALIYTNPRLPRIGSYKQDVQLVILAEKDGTSFEEYKIYLEKYSKTGFYNTTVTLIDKDGNQYTKNVTEYVVVQNRSLISVAGNLGIGAEPMYAPVQEDGRVQWWSKEGIHYEVIANLPVQELLRIAESIQHV